MTAPVRVPDTQAARVALLELARKHGGVSVDDWCWRLPSCAACRRLVAELEEAGLDAWGSADVAGLGADSTPRT